MKSDFSSPSENKENVTYIQKLPEPHGTLVNAASICPNTDTVSVCLCALTLFVISANCPCEMLFRCLVWCSHWQSWCRHWQLWCRHWQSWCWHWPSWCLNPLCCWVLLILFVAHLFKLFTHFFLCHSLLPLHIFFFCIRLISLFFFSISLLFC